MISAVVGLLPEERLLTHASNGLSKDDSGSANIEINGTTSPIPTASAPAPTSMANISNADILRSLFESKPQSFRRVVIDLRLSAGATKTKKESPQFD